MSWTSSPGGSSDGSPAPRRAGGRVTAPERAGVPFTPVDTPALALPSASRGRGVCAPRDLHVAVRTNELGVVVHVAGPFLDEADARTHVATEFDGQGYAVQFELVFRSPRRRPPAL